MATLIATANGNFTSAATWGVVDATSLLDSETSSATALTTSYVASQNFTPGAITIDGIAVKIGTRAASPSGTMSIQLFDATAVAAVAGTEVTVNVSDIASATLASNGWFFLKFAAPVLLLAATNYNVQGKTSSASQVNLYRNSTAANWSRMLRTTTTAAPGAGDNWFVLGEWTAAATKTNRSVTMNETAATDYGGASTTITSFGISNGGTLTWGATAATNYLIRLSGLLTVWAGGIHQVGTVAVPIPVDSTAVIEWDCAADGDFGQIVWGTLIAQGLPPTSGKNIHYALLNTDEAAAQTTLGVDRDTGWKSGNEIIIASTTRTPGDTEIRTLNGDATATTVAVTAGLTNAHSGTSPTQGEVALLTRNVRSVSVTTTAAHYTRFEGPAIVDCDWVEFRYAGTSTTGKRAVEVMTVTGAVNLKYCAFRDIENTAVMCAGSGIDINHVTIDSCVFATIAGGTATINHNANTTGTDLTITNCVFLDGTTNVINFDDNGWTFTNNRIVASCSGSTVNFNETNAPLSGTLDGNVIHSTTGTVAWFVASAKGARITNTTIWRMGAGVGGFSFNAVSDIVVDGASVFGCGDVAILFGSSARRIILRDVQASGDTTFSSARGVQFSNPFTGDVRLENCSLGVVSGIFTAFTTGDLSLPSSGISVGEITLINTILASATEFENKTGFLGRGAIRHERVDGTTNVHKTEFPALGTVEYDAAVFRTAAPSEKLTPTSAPSTLRLRSSRKRIPVAAGKAITAAVYLRKSALYAGSAPRLIMAANPAIGLDDDLVLDTMAAAAETWEQLTGTQTPVAEEDGVVECYWDCDGSAGFVNGDDWSATTS